MQITYDKSTQAAFLVLTFVVVIIIAMSCPDLRSALTIIGALAAAGFLAMELAKRHGASLTQRAEAYTALPGAPAPYPVKVAPPAPTAELPATGAPRSVYPGAIEVSGYETEPEFGHRDRLDAADRDEPYGNPYNRSRISRPAAAAADVDDEANDAEMDADELNTYQASARNDAVRVAAGTMNRRTELDPYFREEVEEAEDREWWGRHEL